MRTLIHLVHGLVIGIGALAVCYALLPGRWQRRRSLTTLREARTPEALVALAHQRASAEFETVTAGPESPPDSRGRRLVVIAAIASVAAAGIHGAVGPEHFREALRLGLFFVLICVLQLALAFWMVRRPSPAAMIATIVVSGGTVLLWVATRTVGLPGGLAEKESVGTLDVLASTAELLVVACCIAWLQCERSEEVPPERRAQLAMAAPHPTQGA